MLIITLAKILFLNLSKKFVVSYDVTSLFSNIPLQETIDIGINLIFIFNHNPNLNITKKELEKRFLFATSQIHFNFNSKFYNQIDEVTMGSPLRMVSFEWVLLWVFTNLSGLTNIIFTNLNFI